jgi:pimeloyl-ACP methyl ester carboxylesterase
LLGLFVRLLPLQWIVPVIARSKLIRLGLQGAYTCSITNDLDLQQLIRCPARRPTAARALRAMTLGMSLRPRGATAPALLEQLATTQLPMLMLWGRNDRFVPLMLGQQVVDQHPSVELNVLNHCGHCPHDEDPNQFLSALLPWLDRNLGSSRPAGDFQQT